MGRRSHVSILKKTPHPLTKIQANRACQPSSILSFVLNTEDAEITETGTMSPDLQLIRFSVISVPSVFKSYPIQSGPSDPSGPFEPYAANA